MLNKLTAQKKVRSEDQYSPGGRSGHAAQPGEHRLREPRRARPSRACRWCSAASRLRCGASRTTTTGATRCAARSCSTPRPTCSIFGMGERPVWEVAERLKAGEPVIEQVRDVRGTASCCARASGNSIEGSRFVRDGKPVILPELRRGLADTPDAAGLQRGDVARVPARDQPGQRAPAPAGARRRGGLPQPARAAARRRRPWTSSTTCRSRARPHFSYERADPRVRDGEALHRDDARLLRRLHLLLDHRARGARDPVALGRERAARGAGAAPAGRLPRRASATSAGPPRTCTRCAARRSASRRPAAGSRASSRRLREPGHRPHARCVDLAEGKVRKEPGVRRCSSPRACATTSRSGSPSSSTKLATHHTGGQLSRGARSTWRRPCSTR